jgi:hypothetical protein
VDFVFPANRVRVISEQTNVKLVYKVKAGK